MAYSSLLTTMLVTCAVALGQGSSQNAADSTSAGTTVYQGSAVAGKAMFDGAGKCLSCHRVGVAGSALGLNLSDVGSRVSPAGLRQRLMKPPAKVLANYRLYEVVLRDGKTVRGKLLNQDPFSLQMLNSGGELVAYARSEIRGEHFVEPPQMPSYQDRLTSAQIDDLVAYLASLRTPENQ